MKAERLAQVEDIYHAVLEVSAEEWPSFLTSSCGGDADLRREVESLLSYSNKPHSLIDVPPLDVAAELVRENHHPNIIGKKIKHYKILSQIGTGGMGDVFLAKDTVLERNVAIKFVSKQFSQDAAGLKRFLREAKTASSLNHPNIITVHEVGKTKDTPFIATEFIEGKTLRNVLDNGGLRFEESIDIVVQVASALIAAHSAGIYHRDIKPENIMLRSDKLVKVLDFGLAKIAGTPTLGEYTIVPVQNDLKLSSPGLVMGTLAYMSPEQAAGKITDARSDIWSLGVVMFEMFSGQKPFIGDSPDELRASILDGSPLSLVESIPVAVRDVIAKTLAKDPNARYQSADELLSDINKFGGGQVVRARRKHRVLTMGVGAMLIALLSFAGYYYSTSNSKSVNSIAVMPFENESGDTEGEYLSDGMSEALINELSQLQNVKVIARGSSFKYKGQNTDIQRVARELGVQAIMTGKVSLRDGMLNVNAELVNASDNSQIWGGSFVRRRSELEQIHRDIVRQIGVSLNLLPAKSGQQVAQADPQAYELLLKGRYSHSKSTEEGAKKAIEYFEQAIAIDPNYALAHAAMASSYLYLGANGFDAPNESMERAEIAAARAQELNGDLAEVHLASATINQFAWNWAAAENEFEKATELNANLASVHFGYALFLSTQGRHEQAIVEMKQARDLDPLKKGINLNIAYVLYFAQRYDEALEQYSNGIDLVPEYGGAYYGRGLARTATGNFAEAITDFKEMIRLNGEHTGVNCYLGYALAKAGRINESRAILRRLEKGIEYVSPVELAILYIGLGEKEKALAALERGFAERDSQMQFLMIEPNFNEIRSEPRFAELVRKVGLPS
ncbi:MAG: protein kinase [Pyrinomonadaceae bacterium]|nr:protein kinase [Acidobacteriota bacterium]MBP7375374.1 protein kinase [Pyrinomonadaceae bacterium]